MQKIAPVYILWFLSIGVVGTALIAVYTISVGIVYTPVSDVVRVLWSHIIGTESGIANDTIIWHIRTPRMVLALLVGSGLALVGCMLQALVRNPLADPHLFGISSGGALGAVVVVVFVGGGVYTMSIGAFLGAFFAMGLVMIVATAGTYTPHKTIAPERLLLSGVAVSFMLMAMTNFIIFQGENNSATAVLFWMLGGMGLARWDMIWIPFIVLVVCVPYAIIQGRNLNSIMSGDKTALTLGVNVYAVRIKLFLLCALITGVCVAMSGAIGFVGLMVPHMCRYFVGANNRYVLGASAIFGGLFLVIADALSRTLFAPQELPIGILTAFVGGGFFITLMFRKK